MKAAQYASSRHNLQCKLINKGELTGVLLTPHHFTQPLFATAADWAKKQTSTCVNWDTKHWTVKHQQAKRASLGKLQSLSHPGVQVSDQLSFKRKSNVNLSKGMHI